MSSQANIILTASASFLQFFAGFCFLYLAQYYLSPQAFTDIGELRATINLLVPITMFGSQIILVRFASYQSISYFFSFIMNLNLAALCCSLLIGVVFKIDFLFIFTASSAITLYSLMEYRARSKGSVTLSALIKGPIYFVALNSTIIVTIMLSLMFHIDESVRILFPLITCLSFFLLMLSIYKLVLRKGDLVWISFKKLTPLLRRGTARIPLAFMRTLVISLPVLLSSWYLSPLETSNVIIGMMVVRSVAIIGNGISPAVIQIFSHPNEQLFYTRFFQITAYYSVACIILIALWEWMKFYFTSDLSVTSFFYLLTHDDQFLFAGLLLGAFSIYRSILDAKSNVLDVYLVYVLMNSLLLLGFMLCKYYNLDVTMSELITTSMLLSNTGAIIVLMYRLRKIVLVLPFCFVACSILIALRFF